MSGLTIRTEEDLIALIGQIETSNLEFKKLVPPGDGRAEFAKDCAAMANAKGGTILVGVAEEQGVAMELIGIPAQQADSESRRLRSIIDAQLKPRLAGARIELIGLRDGNQVLAVHVPRAWSGPIMVREEGKFWIRRERQNALMDVDELRDAFLSGTNMSDRMTRFQEDFLDQVIDQGVPLPLDRNEGILMLFLLPWTSFGASLRIDVGSLTNPTQALPTPLGLVGGNRVNIDGRLTFATKSADHPSGFTQLFGGGVVAAGLEGIVKVGEGSRGLDHHAIRQALHQVPTWLRTLQTLGVEPPITISGVLDGVLGTQSMHAGGPPRVATPIDRKRVWLPNSTMDDFNENPNSACGPLWTAVWNALGYDTAPIDL